MLDVTLADIQEHGHSAKVRNVPVAVKREAYASYGVSRALKRTRGIERRERG